MQHLPGPVGRTAKIAHTGQNRGSAAPKAPAGVNRVRSSRCAPGPVHGSRHLAWLVAGIFLFLCMPSMGLAAQVTLAWDPNDPAPEGYCVFQRLEGESYDYSNPVWPGPQDDPTQTTCTITNLADDTLYYFVVRAYVGADQSGDSNEVTHQTPAATLQDATISASAGANGSISPSGSVSVPQGGSQRFDFSADPGYHINDVVVDGQSTGAVTSYTFSNVTQDHAISASFAANTYSLTASAGSGGTVSPEGAVSVTHGSSRTFTFAADTGYHIADVSVDGQSIGARSSYTFDNVTQNHTVAVAFAANTYTITATSGPGGSIAPQGSVSVQHGAGQTFTFTPDSGYHVSGISVNGQSIGAASSYAFSEVTQDQTISVSFSADTYTITATSGPGGSISPQGSVSVQHGAGQTFTFTPDSGYHVSDVTIDGQSAGSLESYAFSNISGDHSIGVSFSAVTHTITATAGPGGSISPAGTVTVAQGGSQEFDILTDTGYVVSDVRVDGASVGAVGSYRFSSIGDSHTIEAVFELGNQAPLADAGDNIAILSEASAVLDGSASRDPEGGTLTYHWIQTNTPAAVISNPSAAQPTITAPSVVDTSATLIFELTVTDPEGLTSSDTCLVQVDPPLAPDTDQDGTPDSEDNDDDNDGMPDAWELQYGFDPLVADADMDADNDGVSNYEEYQNNTNPLESDANQPPNQPAMISPADGDVTASKNIWLVADAFSDPNADDTHAQSQWRISRYDNQRVAFDRTCSKHNKLTSVRVPRLVLRSSTTYTVMVRFFDQHGQASEWSHPVVFTTAAGKDDLSTSGSSDFQEPASAAADTSKDTAPGVESELTLTASVEDPGSGSRLDLSEAVDSDELESESSTQSQMPFGLLGYRIELDQAGESATVTLRLSQPAGSEAPQWICYNSIDEWRECTDTTWVDPDGLYAERTIEDGGIYDADGVANGTIVEISGPMVAPSDTGSSLVLSDDTSANASDSATAGCFISSMF